MSNVTPIRPPEYPELDACPECNCVLFMRWTTGDEQCVGCGCIFPNEYFVAFEPDFDPEPAA